MEEAIRLIIARCSNPNVAPRALATLEAYRNNSPVVQIRYSQLLSYVFATGTEFTPEERELLASAIGPVEPTSSTRDFTLHVRLTQTERVQLQDLANQAGVDMSEYVRSKIF